MHQVSLSFPFEIQGKNYLMSPIFVKEIVFFKK